MFFSVRIIKELRNMLKISKKGECIRNVANYSKQTISNFEKFDDARMDLSLFGDQLDATSPKLVELIKTIREIDAQDLKKHGTLFKHVIYTDIRKSASGAKMIATGLTSAGFTNCYDKSLKLKDIADLAKNKNDNFALLSSVAVYGKPFPVSLKKSILATFNQRPDNVHGQNIRIIVLDQGFKEGIDIFDVKYMHLFEPLITNADEKQAIGRGTRFCGQKGLEFHKTDGWPLHVFKYDVLLDSVNSMNYVVETLSTLFLQNSGIDINKLNFAKELEAISRYGAVDNELTANIHKYTGNSLTPASPVTPDSSVTPTSSVTPDSSVTDSPGSAKDAVFVPKSNSSVVIGQVAKSPKLSKNTNANLKEYIKYRNIFLSKTTKKSKVSKKESIAKAKAASAPNLGLSDDKSGQSVMKKKNNTFGGHYHGDGAGIKGKKKKGQNLFLAKAPVKAKNFIQMRKYIRDHFMKYKWDNIKFENKCTDTSDEVKNRIVKYTPTQDFVSKYFTNASASKGLLLWHSVGTGKTCSAIAVASNGFEPHGYTILWVTRHTLKADVWKNMYGSVCSAVLRRRIEAGEDIPEEVKRNPLKYLSNSWIVPISYKQFTNMLLEKNDIFRMMKKRNGTEDPLKKTLVIIDEVHKLYSADLPSAERPNVNVLKNKIHHSYKHSGKNSVRLLLMSATPYTSDPMDLIKILNLISDGKQLPETFEEFSKEYLDEHSIFTNDGAVKFLDHISSYISYLNREKDIRQFSYPVFYNVFVKMSKRDKKLDDKMLEISEKLNELKKTLKKMPKDGKSAIKAEIKELKAQEKKIKEGKNDLSQETSLISCMKK